MDLATTIGKEKSQGKNFCLASERLLRLKIIASCRLMVINVYLIVNKRPIIDHDRVKPGHALLACRDWHTLLTAATGNGQNDRP